MTVQPEAFHYTALNPPVRGYLHRPATPVGAGLVLVHGAGSNAQAPLLVALGDAFSAAGITVLRCDLPYRQLRSYGPPRPGDATRDRQGIENALTVLRQMITGRLFVGGQSYGGRQASMVCAEKQGLVEGLLLLSYPLHPPGKPQQLRTQHLPKLSVPTLVVQGTRDPFGSIEEIQTAMKLIPGKTRLIPVEGAGHDLGYKKGKTPAAGVPLVESILNNFTAFFVEQPSAP